MEKKDESFVSDRVLVVDVPENSLAIINIESGRVHALNMSRIEFVNPNVSYSSLLFNFLNATEITLTPDSATLGGSILAPHATFLANGGDDDDKVLNVRGQLFVRGFEAVNFQQQCEHFEPFF
jgi:choice-of-anchor A domain-containing protein